MNTLYIFTSAFFDKGSDTLAMPRPIAFATEDAARDHLLDELEALKARHRNEAFEIEKPVGDGSAVFRCGAHVYRMLVTKTETV